MTDCVPCANARDPKVGYWGVVGITHCRRCHRTWPLSRTREAHCPTCCAHFSSPSGFDAHLRPVGASPPCRPPGELRHKDGRPVLVQREDGTWAFPPPEDDSWLRRRAVAQTIPAPPPGGPDTEPRDVGEAVSGTIGTGGRPMTPELAERRADRGRGRERRAPQLADRPGKVTPLRVLGSADAHGGYPVGVEQRRWHSRRTRPGSILGGGGTPPRVGGLTPRCSSWSVVRTPARRSRCVTAVPSANRASTTP